MEASSKEAFGPRTTPSRNFKSAMKRAFIALVAFFALSCGTVTDTFDIITEEPCSVVLRVHKSIDEYHIEWMWRESIKILPVPPQYCGHVIHVHPRYFMTNTECEYSVGLRGCFVHYGARRESFIIWYKISTWEVLRHEFLHVLLVMHGMHVDYHHEWMEYYGVLTFPGQPSRLRNERGDTITPLRH
jgi:hypothetical protein